MSSDVVCTIAGGAGFAGDRVDPAVALALYRAAAHQGHVRAMNLLGRCHEHAWGTAHDSEIAADWYRRSAEGGYFRGQFNWASVLLARGKADEAAHWFERAATQGSAGVRRATLEAVARARSQSPQLERVWQALRVQA